MQPIGPFIKTQISLLPGQSHFEQLRRGDMVDVVRGSVLMVSRVYLDPEAILLKVRIGRGSVYRVPVSGAFEMAAECGASMALVMTARRGGIFSFLMARLPKALAQSDNSSRGRTNRYAAALPGCVSS